MKTRSMTSMSVLGAGLVIATLLPHGHELAENVGKAVNFGKEVVCVGQDATMGIVTIGAVDCAAVDAGTGTGATKTTPATPKGPSADSTGN